MSRLTGSDALGLYEAYQAVYNPQELTEEQVWEEVETWVNSLLEEGYDLSEYTWEEMYESYLEEQGSRQGSAAIRNQNVYTIPTSSAGTRRGAAAGTRTLAARPSSSPMANLGAGYKPAAPAAKQTGDKTKDMATWAKANPKLAAAAAEKARIRGTSQSDNPLMKGMPGKRPMTPSVQSPTLAKDLGKGSGNQSLLNNPNASKAAPPKAAPTTAAKPTPRQGRTTNESYDYILSHLIYEGYANTVESAEAIILNMSEDWILSIIG
jgi:hypothetical protein